MIASNLLRGDRIRFTAVESRDLATMARWWQDIDFLRHFDSALAYPKTEDQLSRMVSEQQASHSDFLFALRPLDADDLLGLFQFSGIQWNHGTSYIAIGIGDPANRQQGLGREAMQLGLAYGFQEMNLHRVVLTVFSYNEPAMTLYEQLGFVREGVHREHLLRDGQRYDMSLYGLLRREWLARQND